MGKKIKHEAPEIWFRVEAAHTEEEGLATMNVDGIPFRTVGKVGEATHVIVPPTATKDQIDRVSKIVEKATGHLPLVFTSNVQLVKLKRISNGEAARFVEAQKLKQKG